MAKKKLKKAVSKDESMEQTAEELRPQFERFVTKPEINRMIARIKSPTCPECDSDAPVCTQRTDTQSFFRCRECGHRWGREWPLLPGQR